MRQLLIIGIFILVVITLTVLYFNRDVSQNQTSIPQPQKSVNSTNSQTNNSGVKISSGETPSIPFNLPPEFTIHTFAKNLSSPRDLQFSPDGTLLVSVPNTGEVVALPDKNGDGVADSNRVIIRGENHPHGLAFNQGKLFVADVNKVVRFNFDETNLTASKEKDLFSLPENGNHNNRTIIFNDGKMYVSVGSTCNVCNENSNLSATVLISDADGNNPTVFARGLRNAPFIQFNPKTNQLWGTEMGRDYLGDNTPPDEINVIEQGKDYGWPICYGNKIHDMEFDKGFRITPVEDRCKFTQSPIFEIPAHGAPLGLTFINSSQFNSDWQGDLLVSYHGSWNRSTPIGYKVVHLKVSGNTIISSEDFLTGFISSSASRGTDAQGRPVDLTFDSAGNLYLSDDKNGLIYIIQKK